MALGRAEASLCHSSWIVRLLTSLETEKSSFTFVDLKLDTFDPQAVLPSDFYLLVQLDSVVDAGITPASFQQLFTECRACHTCIARLQLMHHDCATMLSMLPGSSSGDRVRLLQAVSSDGLPPARFEALFFHCKSCDRIMTHRASVYHDCVFNRLSYRISPLEI